MHELPTLRLLGAQLEERRVVIGVAVRIREALASRSGAGALVRATPPVLIAAVQGSSFSLGCVCLQAYQPWQLCFS